MKRCKGRGPGCSGCTRIVCAVVLSSELKKSLAADEMTERFVELAIQVSDGYFSQRSFAGYPSTAHDDFKSRFIERLLKDWKKADPSRNVFSFLTGMARFSGLDVKRKFDAHKRRMEKLKDSGGFGAALEETAI